MPSCVRLYCQSIEQLLGMGHTGLTNNFFRILDQDTLAERTQRCLNTYALIFRFGIQKLTTFLGIDPFQVLILQYLSKTRMERVHRRSLLARHQDAYYRAVENFINLSPKSEIMIATVRKNCLKKSEFKVSSNEMKINLSLRKLFNKNKNLEVQPERDHTHSDSSRQL